MQPQLQGPGRVLIVDDHPAMREVLRLLLESELVAITELVEEMVTDRKLAEQRQLVLTGLPERPRAVTGDGEALRAVVGNLLDNAVKHAPVDTPIEVEVEQPAGWTRITVSDHGVGVAVEDRRRIFAPFTQLDASTTRRVGGVGLGLFLVAGMGGRVWVEETPGGGASFVVELPDLPVPGAPAVPSTGRPAAAARSPAASPAPEVVGR